MAFSTPAESCIERAIDIEKELTQLSNEQLDEIYEINRTVDWIAKNNFQRVCLQLPDNLLGDSVRICKRLKSLLDRNIYILADTTYTSCCIDEVASRHVESDAIVHYGHSCLSPTDFPVLYVFPRIGLDVDRAVEAVQGLNSQDILVVYDVSLDHLKESLCQKLFQALPNLQVAVIPKENSSRGVICGRTVVDRNGKEIDLQNIHSSYLVFIGNEGPTLFNLAVCSKARELYHLNPQTSALTPYSQSKWFKRRRYLVERCKDARRVGLLVCTLSRGDYRGAVRALRDLVRASGKKVYTLTVGKPNVAKLANLSEIDVFVLVACPENELYSSKEFLNPIIYPYELELALNQNRSQYEDKYSTDFNEILIGGQNYCKIQDSNQQNPDVSLITGNVRNVEDVVSKIDIVGKELDAIDKEKWAVKELGIGGVFSDRSWTGLQQDLGNTPVELATAGRKGIASSYEGEMI